MTNTIQVKWFILIVYALVPITGMAIDMYAPSLPAMTEYFASTDSWLQLSLSIYLLGFSIGQLCFGPFSDYWGRRNLLLLGASIFVLSCLGAALSPSIPWLIVFRTLQGFGIAAVSAITKAIITDCYRNEALERHASYLTSAWALGPILAPVVGGYLQTYFHWQAVFYILLAYAGFFLVLAWRFLPETLPTRKPLDAKHLLGNYKMILSHTGFIGIVIGLACSYSTMIIFSLSAPFIVQTTLGFEAKTFGQLALVMGVVYFCGTLLNPHLRRYVRAKHLVLAAVGLFFVSGLIHGLFVLIPGTLSLTTLGLANALAFFAIGLYFPICLGRGLMLFQHLSGLSSALLGSIMNFIVTCFMLAVAASPLSPLADMSLGYCLLALGGFLIFIFVLAPKFFNQS